MADIDTGKARSNVRSALDLLPHIGSDLLELDIPDVKDLEGINDQLVNLRALLTSACIHLGGDPK
ncbi:MAG: hypothetical protein F4Z28_15430 [Gammaproteobacteria bacterium]|nr:hypothetical protein [Gammaproteobacteria bacterium]